MLKTKASGKKGRTCGLFLKSYSPVLDLENAVAVFQGLHAVRYDDDGKVLVRNIVDGFGQHFFRSMVECTGGFIKNEYFSSVIQRPRDADSLPLSPRNFQTLIANVRIPSGRQPADKLNQLRSLYGFAQRAFIDLVPWHTESNVVGNRTIEKRDVLRNETHQLVPGFQVVFIQLFIINIY